MNPVRKTLHHFLCVLYAPLFFAGFIAAALRLVLTTGHAPMLAGLLLAAIGTSLLAERMLPYEPAFNHAHSDTLRDVLHALVNEGCNTLAVLILPVLANLIPETGLWPMRWPLWAQLGLAVLVADAGITLTHYFSHKYRLLWRFHAVHHAVRRLYGLNGLLKHPVHQAIELSAAAIPLLILGIPQPVAWLLAFAVAIQLLLQHANVDMRMGPLIYVWAVAPAHRFHHVNTRGEGDVNFGLFTTLWDHLLGTWKRVPGRRFAPGDFGIAGQPDYPQTYGKQLQEPFRCGG